MFDNSRQYRSRQVKAKLKLQLAKAKLKLWCHVVAAESSCRVQDSIDEVVSLPAALLLSWAMVKDLYMDVLGMRISQVMIRNLFLQEFVLSWVAWKS
jgi:hypothetical protein